MARGSGVTQALTYAHTRVKQGWALARLL